MNLKVKRLDKDARTPTKATEGSAYYDVYSPTSVRIKRGETYKVPTGLIFEVPRGYVLDIRPRSGLAYSGALLLNSPGTLDPDYRGELLILLHNLCSNDNALGDLIIKKGDRTAQIGLLKVEPIEFEEVEGLNETERGIGGFGSTGR